MYGAWEVLGRRGSGKNSWAGVDERVRQVDVSLQAQFCVARLISKDFHVNMCMMLLLYVLFF